MLQRLWLLAGIPVLGGCAGVNRKPGPRVAPEPPRVVLSSDLPLAVVSHNVGFPITPSASIPLSSSVVPGAVSATAPSYTGSGIAQSGAGESTVVTGASGGNVVATAHDATNTFTVNLNLSLNFAQLGARCSIYAPYSGVTCALPTFSLPSSILTQTAALKALLVDSGPRALAVGSNALSVRNLVLETFTRTSSSDDDPKSAIEYKGYLYFIANNTSGRAKIWRTDGLTVSQFSNVSQSAATSDNPQGFQIFKDELYFRATPASGSVLLKTDGDTITAVGGERSPQTGTPHGDYLYYQAYNSGSFYKLYRTDGTTVSNHVNIQAATANDNPTGLISKGPDLFFRAQVGSSASKLFKTNGTQVSVVGNVSANDNPTPLAVLNNELYFAGNNSGGFQKLWRTDGSSTMVAVSNTVGNAAQTDNITGESAVLAGHLYFIANNSAGYQKLFRTDGTKVYQVSNTAGSTRSDLPYGLRQLGNFIYFTSSVSATAAKLFRTNGTLVELLSNTRGTLTQNDSIAGMKVLNNALYFTALDSGGRRRLYETDGASITQLTRMIPIADDMPSDPEAFYFKNSLYFTGYSSSSGSTRLLFRLRPL